MLESVMETLLHTLVAGLMAVEGFVKRGMSLDLVKDSVTSLEWPHERESYFQQVCDRTWGTYLEKGFIRVFCRVPQWTNLE
jgi:hypothetical protein